MFKITLGREYVLQFINPRDVLMKWYIDTVIIRVALLNWIPGKDLFIVSQFQEYFVRGY